MAELNKMIKVRGGVRSIFTRTYDYISQMDVRASEFEKGYLQMTHLNNRLETLNEEILELLLLDDEADIESEIELAATYTTNFLLLQKAAESKSEKYEPVKSSKTNMNVRLPEIKLPTFDGNSLEFVSFMELFSRTIGERDDISLIEKFSYLKGLLKGEAAKAVEGLSLVSVNYENAISILHKRFGSKTKVISSHIKELLHIPLLSAIRNKGLRSMCDNIEVHIRALQTLGVGSDDYSCFLIQIVLSRLPPNLRLAWARQKESDNLDINDLMKFLNNEANAYENCDNTELCYVSGNKQPNGKRSLLASVITKNDGKISCYKCSKFHYLNVCPEFVASSVEERRKFIKENGLCYRCFNRHFIATCRFSWCCKHCSSNSHHTMLHNEKGVNATKDNIIPNKVRTVSETCISEMMCNADEEVSTALVPTLLAPIMGKTKSLLLRVMLDSGSQSTFIKKSIARELDLEVIGKSDISVYGFHENKTRSFDCSKVCLTLGDEDHSVDLIAYETHKLCKEIHVSIAKTDLPVNVDLADNYDESTMNIHILVGADQISKFVDGNVIRFNDNLVGISTVFGISLCGELSSDLSTEIVSNLVAFSVESSHESDLRCLWELESIGINDASKNDATELENFRRCISKQDGRYMISWPLKDSMQLELIDSYETEARQRLQRTLNRVRKDDFLRDQYQEIFEDYLNKDIIEQIPQTEKNANYPIRYLPHHPVVTDDSGNRKKMRVVFDASSKDCNGTSLNDIMITGPKLNPEAVEMLLRFRLREFVIMCDMKAAFLQIGLYDKDKDLVRFLWVKNIQDLDSEVVPYRMKRVIFGAKPSPFILAAVLRYHFENTCHNENFSHKLSKHFYVDDFIISLDEENECSTIAEEVTDIIAGMNGSLSKWHSNCKAVRQRYSNEEGDIEVKALGLVWNREEDILKIKYNPSTNLLLPQTKRQLLQRLASLFDPLGFVSPYLMTGKLLLRETWKMGLDWDAEFDGDFKEKVFAWWKGMTDLKVLQFDRWLKFKTGDDLILYGFSDASEKGMGCIIYAKVTHDEEKPVSLVIAKSRVAPMKRLSIPRLELTAALLCSRLMEYVTKALEVPVKTYFFTDSQIVLGWIKGDANRWKPYVSNRVVEIQNLTKTDSWHYVQGSDNPADIISRGSNDISCCNSDIWLNGPHQLKSDNVDTMWQHEKTKNVSEEIKKEEKVVITSCTIFQQKNFLNISKYSDYQKPIRILAWILRFVRRCQKKTQNVCTYLSGDEIKHAEKKLIIIEQQKQFSNEAHCLRSGQDFEKDSKLTQLQPFIDDDGIMRKGGRLEFSSLSFEEKYPIILDKNSHFTFLLIMHRHEKLMHASVRDTMMDLRSRFWILRARSTIKSVIHECQHCKRNRALPYNLEFCPLPSDRVQELNFQPFYSTGLDYIGPIKMKDSNAIIKGYVLLFTCARIRAVHLECVKSMDLNNFLQTFEIFAARRGKPVIIRSDNFKTFKVAAPILSARYQITWRFNTPAAPWQGGFFERMVRSVKVPLRNFMKNRILMFESFRHRITLIEHAINSRPITALYEESNDPRPISPNDFLIHRGLSISDQDNRIALREEFLVSLRYYRFVWTRWRNEYLRMLNIENRRQTTREPTEGDVVLVEGDGSKLVWPLAVITEVFPARDGKVRTVRIKTSNNKTYIRPIQKLMYLEI